MTTYTINPTTGAYDVVDGSAIECRLKRLGGNSFGGTTAQERIDMAAMRELEWTPDYTMPNYAVQILIDGVRYAPILGSQNAYDGPLGESVYRRCEVIEVRA